jgi:hypothetical protein
VARDTRWANRADGPPDGCPTKGGQAPVEGGQVPDGGREGCPTEGAKGARQRLGLGEWPNSRSRGWPDGGVYKYCWPSFLSTLLQRPVSPARNAGV